MFLIKPKHDFQNYSFISLYVIVGSMITAMGTPLFEVFHPIAFLFIQSFVSLLIMCLIYGAVPEINKK